MGWVEKSDETYSAFVPNDKIYQRYQLHRPVPSWPAYLRQSWTWHNIPDKKTTEDEYFFGYNISASGSWLHQEFLAAATPARVSRLQAHLQLTFWTENAPTPQWMDDGLQNNYSLDMSNIIRRDQSSLKLITPFPLNQAMLLTNPRGPVVARMLSYALRQSIVTTDAETEPVLTSANDGFGQPLAKLDSTHRVSYFYSKYGAGAFIETLQRLGSGQSIDAALQATTGLTQAQFLAAADAN